MMLLSLVSIILSYILLITASASDDLKLRVKFLWTNGSKVPQGIRVLLRDDQVYEELLAPDTSHIILSMAPREVVNIDIVELRWEGHTQRYQIPASRLPSAEKFGWTIQLDNTMKCS